MAERVITRRVLTKGVAWAAPVTIIGTAAPALAASQVNGLNGWVELRGNCGTKGLLIDGRGTYPNRGLWVYPITSCSVTPQNARITFYLPNGRVNGKSTAVEDSGWSVPVKDDSVPHKPSYTGYTTVYDGDWTYVGDESQMRVTSFPYFSVETKNICSQPLHVIARRSVDVGGHTLVHERSVTLGGATSYSAGLDDDSADAVDAQDLVGVV